MRTLAGPSAKVHFTHLSHAAGDSLHASFAAQTNSSSGLATGSAHQIGVLELMKKHNVPLERVCLLDPKAPAVLAPEDGNAFDWFLFGVRPIHFTFGLIN
jgi:ribosome biogenesis SPOUT family RNA methylase Rps3